MANGIDPRYTRVRDPGVMRDRSPSVWEGIAALAEVAQKERVYKDSKQMQDQERDDRLNQNKEQNRLSQDRINIQREQMEYGKEQVAEKEQYAVINQIGDWKTKSEKLRELAASTNKRSYGLMADEIEKNGIAKEAMDPIYMNLTNEDNPYKIREYLLKEGIELDKHFKGASGILRKRADDLDKKYSIEEASVLKSKEYQGLLIEHEKLYGPQYKPKVSMDVWNSEHQKIKAKAADLIQSPITAKGIMPVSEDDMAAIWANTEARDYWLMNPADDLSEIKKKYKMVEEEEEEEEKDDDKDEDADRGANITTVKGKISELEDKLSTLRGSRLTTLPEYGTMWSELDEKKAELARLQEEEDLSKAAEVTGRSIEELRKEREKLRVASGLPAKPGGPPIEPSQYTTPDLKWWQQTK